MYHYKIWIFHSDKKIWQYFSSIINYMSNWIALNHSSFKICSQKLGPWLVSYNTISLTGSISLRIEVWLSVKSKNINSDIGFMWSIYEGMEKFHTILLNISDLILINISSLFLPCSYSGCNYSRLGYFRNWRLQHYYKYYNWWVIKHTDKCD